jgi:hypothetical protein
MNVAGAAGYGNFLETSMSMPTAAAHAASQAPVKTAVDPRG